MEVAAEGLDQYPDGVFFVDLSPLTDPALVVSTIASLNIVGATGLRRMASFAHHSRYSSDATVSGLIEERSGARRRISSRARAIAAGFRCSSQINQASVLAVVSSPASSIVSTLPAMS